MKYRLFKTNIMKELVEIKNKHTTELNQLKSEIEMLKTEKADIQQRLNEAMSTLQTKEMNEKIKEHQNQTIEGSFKKAEQGIWNLLFVCISPC